MQGGDKGQIEGVKHSEYRNGHKDDEYGQNVLGKMQGVQLKRSLVQLAGKRGSEL